MFCLFSPSKCVELLQICGEEKVETPRFKEDLTAHKPKMHSSEPTAVQSGPLLLQQLGRLIIRARSTSPSPSPAAKLPPSTSQLQAQPQLKCDEDEGAALEEELSRSVHALWTDMESLCIEVLLAAECSDCSAEYSRERHSALLLERWTMTTSVSKSQESPAFINSQWLLNAVRSQLHFSQLSAWLATLQPPEPRRKLSNGQCNFKKLEGNFDEKRKLNIVYSINSDKSDFTKPSTDHIFPLTDIGNNMYLKITLQSLPRIDDIPNLKCPCQNIPDELVGKLNDLNIGSRKYENALLSSNKKVLDDRMLTPCSENGKHKCCDDESDSNKKGKKLDERRIKEIAKYKRRIRKEKMKHLCESTSSEDGKLKETTSIPILQASRFDRFRAIGCYRNQTYLTLPASRIETKSPFVESDFVEPEFRRTNTVGTQTDEVYCECGNLIEIKCDNCTKGMVRSEANYNLASLGSENSENGARRKLDEDDDKALKKLKCDNSISNLIKRPKLRRVVSAKLDKIVTDRQQKDIKELHLNTDDSVFSVPKDSKRQKTFSISDDDYVLYEKCDYGTIDRHELESPKEPDFKFALPHQYHDLEYENGESIKEGFIFPDPKKGSENIPSPSEMDKFRWRFDSAASMVFHTKTGLPLTSSPAPLRRGNNCFDFDDSINGISGIKSALFHPISPVSPAPPASPASPPAPLTPRVKRDHKIKIPPSTGLLGSFEESALQGRLEAVATVHGFTAELGASGAFCPPHKRLPVTVFFYAPGGTNAPYMGHINLGPQGYRVSRSGTIQVSLFNPHGTLVKMFVVLYDLTCMPPMARTFLRQRTLYMPAQGGGAEPPRACLQRWLRYLIHLRFMTSKSGKLYLHTDIRLIVSRKADLDTATAHSALFRPIPTKTDNIPNKNDNKTDQKDQVNVKRAPNRVFGGSSEFDSESDFENQDGVSYELRSFTYAPENPKYSPR